MVKSLFAFAFAASLLGAVVAAGPASAQSQIGPFPGGVLCCAYGLTAGEYAGQSFQVPVGQTGIMSASMALGDNSGGQGTNFVIELRTYNAGVLGGAALAISGPFSTTIDPFTGGQVFTLAPAGGIPVTPLATYALIARNTGGQGTFAPMVNATGVYAGGKAIDTSGNDQSTRDIFFQVNFGTAVAVPSLSDWGMMLLGLTLAGGAALVIQRRRLAAELA